jgi:tetratricopeptide (TPR) repeat protein
MLRAPRNRSGGAAAAAPSPSVIAVFPFAVRGDSLYGYLREGMVDLLSAEFDGVGRFAHRRRARDSRRRRDRRFPGARSKARRRGGRAAGAGRFILGEIVGSGGRLRADARLYDRRGRLEGSAQADVAGEERLFEVVDRLAGRLLPRNATGSGTNIRLLAASTTGSLAALKAFLDGDAGAATGRIRDRGGRVRPRRGDRYEFFAGLLPAGHSGVGRRAERARPDAGGARAARRGRTARATRMLLDGLIARVDGDLDRAEGLYRQLITLAPDEPDAWFGLADVLFHFNAFRGPLAQEAAPYFEHALSLQPDNMSVRLHLANIAARRRDYARHDSLLASLPPGVNFSRFVRLVRAFAGDDSVAQDRVTREFSGGASRRLGEALHYIVRLAHNPRAGHSIPPGYTRNPGRSPEERATGRIYHAGLELTLGHWNAAVRDLKAADALAIGPPCRPWRSGPSRPSSRPTRRAGGRCGTTWSCGSDRGPGAAPVPARVTLGAAGRHRRGPGAG